VKAKNYARNGSLNFLSSTCAEKLCLVFILIKIKIDRVVKVWDLEFVWECVRFVRVS